MPNKDDTRDRRADPADAFAALGDPLRVNILHELSAHSQATGDAVAGFAELRKRVGIHDSGRFRYHLNELRDNFVEKADGGYQLTHAGRQMVGAILAGTYTDEVSMGPAELDSDCPFCGTPAVAACEDGRCFVTCANDHTLFEWSVLPNAVADTPLSEVVNLAELLASQAIEQALAGVCPQCYDQIETAVIIDDPSRPAFRAVCDTCGARIDGPVSFCLLANPEIAAFCRHHGIRISDNHVWEFPFVGDGSTITVTNKNPARVEFALSLGNEMLSVTINECGSVAAVDLPVKMMTDE